MDKGTKLYLLGLWIMVAAIFFPPEQKALKIICIIAGIAVVICYFVLDSRQIKKDLEAEFKDEEYDYSAAFNELCEYLENEEKKKTLARVDKLINEIEK